jgi:xanthine dehydrogenase/oxidase
MVIIIQGARVLVQSEGEDPREVPIDGDFFVSYRKTKLHPSDVVLSIFIPFTQPSEYIMSYKQSKRREDDLAIVSAAYYVDVKDSIVTKARFAYGGMAARTIVCASYSFDRNYVSLVSFLLFSKTPQTSRGWGQGCRSSLD